VLQEYLKNIGKEMDMEIELIDEQIDNVKFKRYKISGVPTLLIFKNHRIVKRWLGEITYDKLETLMRDIFKN
jgi:hypothetical protein